MANTLSTGEGVTGAAPVLTLLLRSSEFVTDEAYLIHTPTMQSIAQSHGLSLIHSLNAVELFDMYRSVYASSLKNKIGGRQLKKGQVR